jgi:hypothetical protein
VGHLVKYICTFVVVLAFWSHDVAHAQSLMSTLKEQMLPGKSTKSSVSARTQTVSTKKNESRSKPSSKSARSSQVRLAQFSKPKTREEMYVSCRRLIHFKYGWKGFDGKYYLYSDHSFQATDSCVTSGGRIR